MRNLDDKKGFAITWLSIIIVVIVVLAVVLIRIFLGHTTKKNLATDIQLVCNINEILKAETTTGKHIITTDEIKTLLVDKGIADIFLKSKDHVLYWASEDNFVVLYNDATDEAVSPEEYIGADMRGWLLLDAEGMSFSQPEGARVLRMVLNQQNDKISEYLAKPGYGGDYSMTQSIGKTTESVLPNVKNFSELPKSAKIAVVTEQDSGEVFYELAVKNRTCTIHSLIPNRTYTVEFKDAFGNRVDFVENGVTYTHAQIAVTGQVRMIYTEMTKGYQDRGVAKGTAMRDLGGWKVSGGGIIKYGLIYRSAKTEILSDFPEDIDFIKNKLGIKHVYDLRADQRHNAEDYRINGLNMETGYYHGLSDGDSSSWYHNYLKYSDKHKEIFQTIFDCVNAGEPILFHCKYGTDRTGTLAFLLGALLGVSDDDLAREFELTMLCSYDGASNVTKDEFHQFIDELNKYSGDTYAEKAEDWFLNKAGFTKAEIDTFRSNMIEK